MILIHFFSQHLLNLESLPGDARVKTTVSNISKTMGEMNATDLATWQRIWEHGARPSTPGGEVRKDFLEKSKLELNPEQLAF